MNPSLTFIQTVNAALTDPNVRASVTQMHAEKVPLLQMVEALGLEDDMPPHIRDIVGSLPDAVVEQIRSATLGMIADPPNLVYAMPLACSLTGDDILKGAAVNVSVAAQSTITIVPTPK